MPERQLGCWLPGPRSAAARSSGFVASAAAAAGASAGVRPLVSAACAWVQQHGTLAGHADASGASNGKCHAKHLERPRSAAPQRAPQREPRAAASQSAGVSGRGTRVTEPATQPHAGSRQDRQARSNGGRMALGPVTPEAGDPLSHTAAQQHSRAEAVEAAGTHAGAPPEALAQLVARVRGTQLAQKASASRRAAAAEGLSQARAADARAPRGAATAEVTRGVLSERARQKRAAWKARRAMLELVRPAMDALGLRRLGHGAPMPPHVSQGRLKLRRWILRHLLKSATPLHPFTTHIQRPQQSRCLLRHKQAEHCRRCYTPRSNIAGWGSAYMAPSKLQTADCTLYACVLK